MKTWLTLTELAQFTGGQIAIGCRARVGGREGTVCVDPYFGRGLAVHFDGSEEYALNITGDRAREILVHHSAINHTNGVKENPNEINS